MNVNSKIVSRTVFSIAAAVAVIGASVTPLLVNAWGDSANGRKSYTIAEINAGKLGDTITFNSISDGKIGDEKNFVGAQLAGTTGEWNADTIDVEDGDTYTIRLYVHNNSPKGTDAIAKDVTTTFSLPTGISNSQTIIGYLDSSNANPGRYWDEVTLQSDDNFYLEYVSGSAEYTNAKMGTVALADEIITSGVKVGYSSLNGEIPGCYEYDGVATIRVKVHKSVNAKLTKTVRIKGNKGWNESVNANVGDEVEYQIGYENILDHTVDNVMIRDVLPANVEYVADSTILYNSNYPSGVQLVDNTVTTTGLNIGSYGAGANAFVRFTAKVVDNSLDCGSNTLVNWASSTVNSKVSKDDASVVVDKTCPTPEPVEDCTTNPELPECVKEFSIDKMVQIYTTDDNNDYTNSDTPLEVKAGDTLRYALKFKNTGEIDLSKVVLKDVLPENVEYVAGSTVIAIGSTRIAAKEGLTGDGLTLHYADGSNLVVAEGEEVTVTFKATVSEELAESCEDVTLTNTVYATASFTDSEGKYVEVDTKQDGAKVLVSGKICPTPEPTPDPEPTPTPENDNPSVIVETGPTEIMTGALGAGSMVTALGCFISSRKKLK